MKIQDNVKYDDIIFGDKCGCYSCKRIFSTSQIKLTVYDDAVETEIAVCPYCDETTVVGDLNNALDNQTLMDISKDAFGSSYYRHLNSH